MGGKGFGEVGWTQGGGQRGIGPSTVEKIYRLAQENKHFVDGGVEGVCSRKFKGGTKLFVAMNRNKKKLIKRVDETFLAVFGGIWIESPIT